jgi:hypothetical protein
MLDAQVRIAQEARAMMEKTPAQLEKEIYAITEGIPASVPAASQVVVSSEAAGSAVREQAPELWEDAAILRSLLFSQSQTSQVSSDTLLAPTAKAARKPSPRSRPRRRRRSPRR